MRLLSVQDISFTWGGKALINHLSFNIDSGHTLGIAGPNGAGKSTLLNLLRGSIQPDHGRVVAADRMRLAMVCQNPDFGTARRAGEFLLQDIHAMSARLRQLEDVLARDGSPAILAEYGDLQDRFAAAGGYHAEDTVQRLLERTGLSIGPNSELERMSGGEKAVLDLVRALVSEPDLLVLDEPGNHLDMKGLAWLERFLGELEQGIIMVSHDRRLLDACAGTILYLEEGRHWIHRGSWTSFRANRDAELEQERKERAMRERELHELEIVCKDLWARAAQSCNPPARVMIELAVTKRKIAELRELQDKGPTPVAQKIRIHLKAEVTKGDIALDVRGLNLAYGERKILQNVSFTIQRGERVALVGMNGCGKSSLLRIIREQASWDHPLIRLAPAMKPGWLSQQSPFTVLERSLVDEVQSWGALSIDGAFSLVAPFGFAWKDLERPLGTLSGGETQRLQLALLTWRQVNFLILDEPGNHLDIPGREALEDCLGDFAGTLLVVSHDRWFLQGFARRVLFLQDGHILSHDGDYESFLASGVVYRGMETPKKQAGNPGRPVESTVQRTAQKAAQKTPEQRAVPDLEARICALEADIRKAEEAVLDAMDRDPPLAKRLEAALEDKKARLAELYARWIG